MRKSLILTIFLFIFSIGTLYTACSRVNDKKDAIAIEETLLFGHQAAAEGITVTSRSTYDYHLFWDTHYTISDELIVKTDFTFSQAEKREVVETQSQITLYSITNFGISGSNIDFDAEGHYQKMTIKPVRDVAGRTPKGETREETVYMSDYYDFYPLTTDIALKDPTIEMNEEIRQAFAGYFKIPVPEEHKIKISVTKDSGGNVINVDSSTLSGELIMTSDTEITNSGIYLVLSLTDGDSGKPMALPEGLSGIHFLPFEKNEGGIRPDGEAMGLVYPLDNEKIQVLQLLQSKDQSRLLLAAEENRTVTLSAIDMRTLELVQKIELTTAKEETGLLEIQQYDSFLVMFFSDGSFYLLTRDPSGNYEIEITGNFFSDHGIGQDLPIYELIMNCDGSRLVVACYQQYYDIGGSTYLLVYDRNGLAYAGKYDLSSDRNLDSERESYNRRVRPLDSEPLRITFN